MIGERFMLPVPCEIVEIKHIKSWRVKDGKEVEFNVVHEIIRPLDETKSR